jgi:hypothetical protein
VKVCRKLWPEFAKWKTEPKRLRAFTDAEQDIWRARKYFLYLFEKSRYASRQTLLIKQYFCLVLNSEVCSNFCLDLQILRAHPVLLK